MQNLFIPSLIMQKTQMKERIIKYIINLYLTAKKLLPYELDVYTTGGIIFNSLILKFYSKKYIGKIDKYSNETFEEQNFLTVTRSLPMKTTKNLCFL